MATIRTFVGHSFELEDEPIITTFLKFFDQLCKMNQNFSWQNAQLAEPKLLAVKVRQLFEDKNLFIGICTKRESVINPSALSPMKFCRGFLKGKAERFQWKTSDWIIQEIGFAVGRGIDLILLIEEGVRLPGGLQGDLEYISFKRNAITESFQKITEMIASLTPKTSITGVVETEQRAPPKEESSESTDRENWTVPNSSWKLEDYEFALFHCTHSDNLDAAYRIDEAFLESTINSEGQNKIRWTAFREYVRMLFDKGGDLQALKKIAAENPSEAEVSFYLGAILEKYERYEEAAESYINSAIKEVDPSLAVGRFGDAARAYHKVGNFEAVSNAVNRLKAMAHLNGLEIASLNSQRELAEIRDNGELFVATLERLLTLNPTDHDLRFKLAYKYSELGLTQLSIFHYLKVPRENRSAANWNNLGVAFDKINLQFRSVAAYRKAQDMQETLAMSNLAIKFLSAGFLQEAKSLCENAIILPDSHRNVATTLANIRSVPEKEQKDLDALLKQAKLVSDFYIDLGRAATKNAWHISSATWQSPDCVLSFKREGEKIVVRGSFVRDSGLRGLISTAMGGDYIPTPQLYTVTYTGTFEGNAFIGHVVRIAEADEPKIKSLIGSKDEEIKCLMILNDDETEIKVMEQREGHQPRFYKFVQIPS